MRKGALVILNGIVPFYTLELFDNTSIFCNRLIIQVKVHNN